MDNDPTIAEMHAIDGRTNKLGAKHVADFSISLRGLRINKCRLYEEPDGSYFVSGPAVNFGPRTGLVRFAEFLDPDLRAQILVAACDEFKMVMIENSYVA